MATISYSQTGTGGGIGGGTLSGTTTRSLPPSETFTGIRSRNRYFRTVVMPQQYNTVSASTKKFHRVNIRIRKS